MKITLRKIGTVDFKKGSIVRVRPRASEYPEGSIVVLLDGSVQGLFRLNDVIEMTDSVTAVEEYDEKLKQIRSKD